MPVESLPQAPRMRVVAVQRTRLGCAEDPLGSNNGACVREAQRHTWLPVPRPGAQGWPWCVAEWQRTVKIAFGKEFPYRTASVAQISDYCRKHGLTKPVAQMMPGDAACIGTGTHITFCEKISPSGTQFTGLGGNQSHRVQRSTYTLSSVVTCIDTARVARLLGYSQVDDSPALPPPPPKRRPRFEIVRGEGERAHVVFTSKTLEGALSKAKELFGKGVRGLRIRKRKP